MNLKDYKQSYFPTLMGAAGRSRKGICLSVFYLIMNQERENYRQDLHMRIGTMKDSKTKAEESTLQVFLFIINR